MFVKSLTEVNNLFSNNSHLGFTLNQWKEKQHSFLEIFSVDIEPLIDILHKRPFDRILEYSRSEHVLWQPNGIRINEFRVRPQNRYYDALKKPIPQPDNPKGPHAYGVELCVGVNRGINEGKVFYPSFVEIKFVIWGHEERRGFISFYRNYRRPIELLLRDLEFEFFTACCFKNLDRYKGTDIMKKLDLYISNKNDPEAFFSVGRCFNKNAELERVSKVFRNLLILYHCCLGYCQENRQLDRVINLYHAYLTG